MRFEFDWDPVKAASNLMRHGVSFSEAMTVFLDPLALSQPDDDHSFDEERWITIGQSRDTKLLLVVHTYMELAGDRVAISIISARRPTRRETRQYEEGTMR
jgi:uncharacterized DUF497 family protein